MGPGAHRRDACATGPPSPVLLELFVKHLHGAKAPAHGALVFSGLGELPVETGFPGVHGELALGAPVERPASRGDVLDVHEARIRAFFIEHRRNEKYHLHISAV